MRPLTYYIGASLDGYIAGPGGEIDFFPVSDDHVQQMVETYPEVLPTHVRKHLGMDDAPNRRFDTVLMGRGTYQPALDIGITNPYAHMRTYVASTRHDLPEDAAVTIVHDPVATVQELKAEDSSSGIWLAGGGTLAGALMCEIDELIVKLYPVLAGAGIPALAGGFAPAAFQLVDRATVSSGCLILTYERN